jgi:hypothetical protein
VKTLTSIVICFALALGFASALEGATPAGEDDPAILIPRVQNTIAAKLDSALPQVSFEEWIRQQIGNDATVNWAARSGKGHDLPWVEADISVGDRPGIIIMIACGKRGGGTCTQPRFMSLELLRGGDSSEWPHLRDLPAAMRKARGER